MSENRPVIIALVVVGLLIVGVIVYFATSSDPEPKVVTQEIAIPKPDPVVVDPEPQYVPPPVTTLPVEEEEEDPRVVDPGLIGPEVNPLAAVLAAGLGQPGTGGQVRVGDGDPLVGPAAGSLSLRCPADLLHPDWWASSTRARWLLASRIPV